MIDKVITASILSKCMQFLEVRKLVEVTFG
jgi:hypothetical protein